MKWAVYVDNPNADQIECVFWPSKEEALKYIQDRIEECKVASELADEELFWDITLLEVKNEVHWTPDRELRLKYKI